MTILKLDEGGGTSVESTAAADTVKRQLEIQKLNREIDALKRWWVAPMVSLLPPLVALVGVIAAFTAASRSGVFESRNNALKADNALLEARKLAYQADITRFQDEKQRLQRENDAVGQENGTLQEQNQQLANRIASLASEGAAGVFIRKLKTDRSVLSSGLDDLAAIVGSAKEDPTGRAADVTDRAFRSEADPTVKALLAYSMFIGTHQTYWRATLLRLLRENIALLDADDGGRLAAIYGDRRWADADKLELCRVLVSLMSEEASPRLQARLLEQVGNLHVGTWWNYHSTRRATSSFRLASSDPDAFLRAVAVARRLAFEHRIGEAFTSLSRFAPPAALSVTAEYVLHRRIEGPTGFDGPASAIQDAVETANENVLPTLKGPSPPTPHEHSFDEYQSDSVRKWQLWVTANSEVHALWMEPQLDRLRVNMRRFATMFDEQY